MNSSKEPIFVIGYPKSGNTWLTRIIADLTDSPILASNSAVDQADKKEVYTGEFVIKKQHYSKHSKPIYITTSNKIFYVIRDFRDVLISGFFYNNRLVKENWVKLDSRDRYLFLRLYFKHQIKRMIKSWVGNELTHFWRFLKGRKTQVMNWSDHVNYWSSFPNAVVVRYEDMLSDCKQTIKVSLKKVGIEYNGGNFDQVIERQSFHHRKLQFELEKNEDNIRFLRKGMSGDWKHFLDEELLLLINREHGETMKRFGYDI